MLTRICTNSHAYSELETKEDYGDYLLKKAAIIKAVKRIMNEKDDQMV